VIFSGLAGRNGVDNAGGCVVSYHDGTTMREFGISLQ
jgi:hypothetical protein